MMDKDALEARLIARGYKPNANGRVWHKRTRWGTTTRSFPRLAHHVTRRKTEMCKVHGHKCRFRLRREATATTRAWWEHL